MDLEVKKEMRDEARLITHRIRDDNEHLLATAKWLVRAQCSSNDHGVSRGYRATGSFGLRPNGWQPSYPETTGYIIPTMCALARYFNEDEYRERALRMADWEIDIQLSSGAVMGSVVTAPPSPAVFNTGQVIFGWLAAFNQSGDQKYLEPALRAGDYLISIQKPDGAWTQGNSGYALNQATTYNTRVAWAIIELGLQVDEDKYIRSGKRNIEFALHKQHKNGWFSENCLNDPEKPLLHTIAYAARGILEAGISLNDQRYIESALRTLDALTQCQRSDGGLPGRLSSDWSAMANWDCLTGDAQVAVALLRAYAITAERKYSDAARSAIEFIKSTQNLQHPNLGYRGGVKGSFPFSGSYGQYRFLSWSAKFFCDAIMLANDSNLREKGVHG